jgi:small subunit ribosomal protein S4
VSQGHFLLNGAKVNIPSYEVKPTNIISLKKLAMKENKIIQSVLEQNITPPSYINFDKEKLTITYLHYPEAAEINKGINNSLVVEWYNKKL